MTALSPYNYHYHLLAPNAFCAPLAPKAELACVPKAELACVPKADTCAGLPNVWLVLKEEAGFPWAPKPKFPCAGKAGDDMF